MERVSYNGRPNSFEWLNGTNVGDTFNNFAPGEPDNEQSFEDCAAFHTSSGLWRSEQCTARPYVCQRGELIY